MGGIRGDRVLIERRALNIDQDELARRAHVSRPYISQIERNKADNVGIKVVYDLAAGLGVSAAYLLGFTDDPLSNTEDIKPGAFGAAALARAEELLDIYRQLSTYDRERLISIAEVLLANSARIVE